MEGVSNEKIIETVKHAMSSVYTMAKSELHRAGYLRQTILDLVGIYITAPTVLLLFEEIWLRSYSPADSTKPDAYEVMCRLSVFETLCKDFLHGAIAPPRIIKYTGHVYEAVKCFLVDRRTYRAAADWFSEAWLNKEFVACLYKLVKQDLLSKINLKEFLSGEELRGMHKYLHYFYARVAYSKVTDERKHSIIREAIRILQVEESSPYYAQLTGTGAKDPEFLHQVLFKLHRRLELNLKYKLQWELEEKLKGRVLSTIKEGLRVREVFAEWLRTRQITPSEARLLSAISFIYNETGDKATEDHTDYTLDFLMISEAMVSRQYKAKRRAAKYSKIVAFTGVWQMLLKLETVSPFFQDAVILKAIAVYKKLIKDPDVAKYAALGLNLLSKIIRSDEYIAKYVDGVIPTIAFGICFSPKPAVRKQLFKVLDDSLNYFFTCRYTLESLQKLQFINMATISQEPRFSQPGRFREMLYKERETATAALNYMLDYLPTANIYSQNLILIYLVDILSGSETHLEGLRRLTEDDPELLRKVCQNILRVNKCYTMHKLDIYLAQSCAHCIQILGPGRVSSNLKDFSEEGWIEPHNFIDLKRNCDALGERLLLYLQTLAFKANKYFHNYIMSIWKLKYLLYVDQNGDLLRKIPDNVNSCFYFPESGGYKRINQKFIAATQDSAKYNELLSYATTKGNLKYLCLYLIANIGDEKMRPVFREIESVVRADTNILMNLIPILIYLVLYNAKEEEEGSRIAKLITSYLCEIISGTVSAHKQIVFYTLGYLKKVKVEESAKIRRDVKHTLKIKCSDAFLETFGADSSAADKRSSQSQSVSKYLSSSGDMRASLRTGRLIALLIKGIPRIEIIKAAKSIRAYKVALYYFEEECRSRAESMKLACNYIFSVLNREELDLLIDIYSNVNKEDIRSEYFSGIIKPSQWMLNPSPDKAQVMGYEQMVIHYWRKGTWEALKAEVDKVNLAEVLKNKRSMIDFSFSDTTFLACIAKLLSLIHTLVHHSSAKQEEDQYKIITGYIMFIQKEIMTDLCGASSTSTYIHSFNLYVLHEIRKFVELIKRVIIAPPAGRPLLEAFAEEPTRREFDELCRIYLDRERRLLGKDVDQLKTLYFALRALFQIVGLTHYVILYTERLAVLLSKSREDSIDAHMLFQECEEYKENIPDYELQYAKTLSSLANEYQAVQFLQSKMDKIKEKARQVEGMRTKTLFQGITASRIYERSLLYLMKLEERLNPKDKNLESSYDALLTMANAKTWEKAYFRYAKYLEGLYKGEKIKLKLDRQQKIMTLYFMSLEYGHRYIWQSLPKALNIWFSLNAQKRDNLSEMNDFVKKILQKLELFKIATAVPQLVSRYAHESTAVVSVIQDIIARLTAEYPLQQVWWLMNYYTFKESGGKTAIVCSQENRIQRGSEQSKLKQEFGTITSLILVARGIIERVKSLNAAAYAKVMEGERVFTGLRNLSETDTDRGETRPMPRDLMEARSDVLIVPLRECLFSQLPPVDATKEEIEKHRVYKPNPVMIRSFERTFFTINSKDKPKKLVIIGSDERSYQFLLKADKSGDLSKEAKFINFIEVINQILKSDKECVKRNLQLQTYAIVNLSSSNAMIEWLKNTVTLHKVVTDLWSENGIEADTLAITAMCKARRLDRNRYGSIFPTIQEKAKPVLYRWFLNRFSDCDSWYNAKMNFVRSSAAWSMVGHVVGLGDRHGDNILLNNSNGEVAHVDYECLFEKGFHLPIPEVVPFRLTKNIADTFGMFREKTEFTITCDVVLKALYRNADNVISNLYVYVHDPLLEKASEGPLDPKKAIEQVSEKLEECAKGTKELVQRLIYQATSEENLKRMFIGWMPWM